MNIPGLPSYEGNDEQWNLGSRWREAHVAIKYRMAERFQPKRICEIGVWSGIAAVSFLAACPNAEYVGIDSEGLDRAWGTSWVAYARQNLQSLGYKSEVIVADSRELTSLPGQFDFIHVDGDHSRGNTCSDMILAWHACAPNGHILVDDGHDTGVCAGIFDAMYLLTNGLFLWEYHSDSVGNILIHRELLEVRVCNNPAPGVQGSLAWR
jgi:predicted O-methyltransferase YrrM